MVLVFYEQIMPASQPEYAIEVRNLSDQSHEIYQNKQQPKKKQWINCNFLA